MDTKPIKDLIDAAKNTLPIFDGLTDNGWRHLRGSERKARLTEAIAAAERAVSEEDKALRLADELSAEVLAHPGKSDNIAKAREYRQKRALE